MRTAELVEAQVQEAQAARAAQVAGDGAPEIVARQVQRLHVCNTW